MASKKKNPELLDVVRHAGFAFEVFKVLLHAVMAIDGTIEHLRRLIKEPELARSVARLIVPELAQAMPSGGGPYRGGPSEAPGFRALVEYVQPSYAILKKAFDWVYDGYKNAEFKPIDVCKDVPTENREIEFELVHLNKEMHTDAILAELDRFGFRPALYEELLGFAKQYPDEQRKYPIVALGSVCRDGDNLCSPCVDEGGGGRGLSTYWIDSPGPWHRHYRFLAVRK